MIMPRGHRWSLGRNRTHNGTRTTISIKIQQLQAAAAPSRLLASAATEGRAVPEKSYQEMGGWGGVTLFVKELSQSFHSPSSPHRPRPADSNTSQRRPARHITVTDVILSVRRGLCTATLRGLGGEGVCVSVRACVRTRASPRGAQSSVRHRVSYSGTHEYIFRWHYS